MRQAAERAWEGRRDRVSGQALMPQRTSQHSFPRSLGYRSGMARDTHGWRGYSNFLKLFGAAIPAALVASLVLAFVPGLRIDRAAETGAIAVALIVAFGLGYAFDASPDRAELYGQARERATTGVVVLFFLVAVTTLGSLVSYQLWSPGQQISLGPCVLGSDACRVIPEVFDPGPWFAGSGMVGLAVTLVGATQLFVALYHPPRLDPGYDSVDIPTRRLFARLVDALVVMAGVLGLLVVWWWMDRGVTGGWLVTAGLWAFLYEGWPLVRSEGRTVGKRLLGLRVLPAGDDERLSWGRVLTRATVTALVYSYGTSFVLAVFLREHVDLALSVQTLLLVGLSISPLMHVRSQGLHDVLLGTRVVRHRKAEEGDTDTGRRTGGHHGRLRLRPSEPADGRDLLDRRSQVGIVTGVLRRAAGPAVVMINAPWGGGKTTFLRMCAAELQSSGVQVVEFNSWTQQYTTKPLLDLVGAISHELQTRKENRLDGGLREFAEPLAEAFGRSRSSRRLFASWDSAHESVRDFSTALSDIASNHGRIVLIVDELDRCQPDYALGTLEALHHLFAVEGVVAVVGVSRDELCHSIRSLYGERFDADTHLRRFADLQIDLPPPPHENMTRFLQEQLRVSGLADRIQPGGAGILQLVTEVEGCSLRDLQQATHLAGLALLPDPPDKHPRSVWEQCALAMIVLRTADREAYRQFARREIDSFVALAAANARFRPTAAGADPMLAVQRTQFEAALLNVELLESPDSANVRQLYRDAHRLKHLDVDLEQTVRWHRRGRAPDARCPAQAPPNLPDTAGVETAVRRVDSRPSRPVG